MKTTICQFILLVMLSLALSGCGQSAGEKALAVVQAKEVSQYTTDEELLEVAESYRAIATQFRDVADKALLGASRATAENQRRTQMRLDVEARMARDAARSTY